MMYIFFDVKMTKGREGATRDSLDVLSRQQSQSGPDPTVVG